MIGRPRTGDPVRGVVFPGVGQAYIPDRNRRPGGASDLARQDRPGRAGHAPLGTWCCPMSRAACGPLCRPTRWPDPGAGQTGAQITHSVRPRWDSTGYPWPYRTAVRAQIEVAICTSLANL